MKVLARFFLGVPKGIIHFKCSLKNSFKQAKKEEDNFGKDLTGFVKSCDYFKQFGKRVKENQSTHLKNKRMKEQQMANIEIVMTLKKHN